MDGWMNLMDRRENIPLQLLLNVSEMDIETDHIQFNHDIE